MHRKCDISDLETGFAYQLNAMACLPWAKCRRSAVQSLRNVILQIFIECQYNMPKANAYYGFYKCENAAGLYLRRWCKL